MDQQLPNRSAGLRGKLARECGDLSLVEHMRAARDAPSDGKFLQVEELARRFSHRVRNSCLRRLPRVLVTSGQTSIRRLNRLIHVQAKNPSVAAASVAAPYIAAANHPMADGPNQSARSPPTTGPPSWPRPRLAAPTVNEEEIGGVAGTVAYQEGDGSRAVATLPNPTRTDAANTVRRGVARPISTGASGGERGASPPHP